MNMELSFYWILPIILIVFLKDWCWCLKNVKLSIEPAVVERYSHSVLRCEYNLENEQLYSVKWYRGSHEFYRYTPTEFPHIKIFPFIGIIVNVNSSNSTQVLLENVEFNLSGNFSCEVTTDTERILSTAMDTKAMLVVQLPAHPPTIMVGYEPLDVGNILRANCSSPPSKPPGLLKFILNNVTVHRSVPLERQKALDYEWSDLTLELPLSEYHFRDGRLVLSCMAQVTHIYQATATLELKSVRNPLRERVRAFSSASQHLSSISSSTLVLHLMYFCAQKK